MRRWFLPAVACAAAPVACSATPSPRPDSRAAVEPPAITASGLEAHVQVLGHDSLEGRGTGTRGYDRAARYVVGQFERLGLEPAGTRGYLQPVRLRRARADSASVVLEGSEGRHELVPVRDFIGIPHLVQAKAEARAPVVFVGFGVTAPDRGHDDYRGIDARGKIVAVLTGGPPSFPATERAHYSTTREKAGNAARHGAVAMLIVRTRDYPQPWIRQVRQSRNGSMRWLEADGSPYGVFPAIRAVAALSDSGAMKLFENARQPWSAVLDAAAQGSPPAFDLPLTASMRVATTHEEIESPNLAALLRGSDPALQREVVVVTAHLDHLGIGEPIRGDSIYNGVWDNASGTAAMLEIARALAASSERPKRSVLFLAVTGEEMGLLGSDYFAEHPTVPIERIVANVNLDGLAIFYPLREVVAHGAAHSTLEETAQRAAERLGLAVVPDPIPAEVVFVRSDQYSFVLRGVPSIFYFSGLRSAPGVDAPAIFQEWFTQRYHTPFDDLTQPRDLEAGAAHAMLALLTTLDIANTAERPAWKSGDFFGRTFGRR
jgi:hypothetical protein